MKFAYTIFYVRDVSAALAFYEAAFGLQRRFLHEGGGYGEMETGGTTLSFASLETARSNIAGGFHESSPATLPPACEVGLITDDVSAAYEQAVAAGAASVSEPTVKPWGQTVAYVRDLDGFLVELCTPMT